MSVAAWNILLRAVVGVLVFGYGIWLRQIIVHQLKAKDSTIESLHAAIEANEAIASRLKDLQAPAIARDLEQMTRTADKYAEEKRQLEEKVKAFEESAKAAGAAVATVEEVKDIASKAYLIGRAEASFEAAAATEKLWELYKSKIGPMEAMFIRLGE